MKSYSRREGHKLQNMVSSVFAALMLAAFMIKGRESATVEQVVVVRPPAQVYAELRTLYGNIERKAAKSSPVIGSTDAPVKLTFEHEAGEYLSFKATAGSRTAHVKTWIEPGPTPEQTRLKVSVLPKAMLDRTGIADVHTAVEAVLRQTEWQLGVGKPLPVLFGTSEDEGSSSRYYGSSYGRHSPNVDPGSTRPMLDVRPSSR